MKLDHPPPTSDPHHPIEPAATPPRPVRWPLLLLALILIAISLALGAAFGDRISQLFQRADASPTTQQTTGDATYYTCGMHPWVIMPGKGDCPICQMELTPLDPEKFTGQITIDPVTVQNIGVRIAPVVTGPLTKTIRTVGIIDYNENSLRDVNTKITGWIDKVHLGSLGAPVKKGDPLFDIYSPQLYAAQEEFLLTLRNSAQSAQLLQAARTRLTFFDISDQQIDALAKAGEPSKTMTIFSPHTGVVVAKHANDGMKVEPGMQVYRIADLSKVWVIATLYEYQLPFVQLGQKAVMSLPYLPGQTFEGQVIYIYPYLDRKTREVQVRLEFDNHAQLLKPGMFANVQLLNTLAQQRVLAPRSAVIDTGQRQLAFVSLGEGRFEPRQLHIGIETDGGMVEVLDGLKPGEMVVTSGQFLIDSESRIREALVKMIKGDLASEQEASADRAGTSELQSLPPDLSKSLHTSLDAYLTIGRQLAADTLQGTADPSRSLASSLEKAIAVDIPGHEHFWHKHQQTIADARAAALKLIAPTDIADARLHYGALSIAMRKLLLATGVPTDYPAAIQVLRCPMYLNKQGGAYWLQKSDEMRNPYMGKRMLECFDERLAMPVTGDTAAPSTREIEP
jgi:RND family efflux transporter MFP subunit